MTFSEIKAKFNLYDVATQMLGLSLRQVSANEYRGVSPAQGVHKTDDAFSISGDVWYDFSAGVGGDLFELVMFVKSCSIVEAAKFIAGDGYDSGYWTKYAEQREKFISKIETAHAELLGDSELAIQTRDYLHSRRITDETIERFKLGLINEYLHIDNELVQEWRLACPYLDMSGNAVYMASRRLDWVAHEGSPKYHKVKQNEFLKNQLFGLNTIPRKDDEYDTLFLGEGMIDALSLAQEGYSVLFSIGGFFGKENEKKAIEIARKFKNIITMFDCDSTSHAGQNFTIQLGKKFLAKGLNFSCVESYGEGCKDVSDYYTTGGNLEELIAKAMNGYLFMSRFTFWAKSAHDLHKLSEYCPFYRLSANEQATSLREVKRFVHELTNIQFGESGRSEILEELKTYYPPEKISEYANGMTRHELLSIWRDEFLEGRHIFFNGSIKGGIYHEYQPKGYWVRMTDASVQSELSEFFRHEKENKDISALSMMVRLMTTKPFMPKFNAKRLWLFQNGVLDLATGEMRNPNPEDYLSWQVSYDYNEDAVCPEFDNFMAEITCNEPSRIDLLDDMLGYIPYEDNRLERIFVLYGDGRNGKGTLLHVIEDLIRNVNTQDNAYQSFTNIPFCEFSKPTQLIMLDGSIANLSYDIDENLKGCESALKSISSGDTISGNYKFCDTVSFTPRCKLICATNHMLKLHDDSLGMKERLMFCRFANCFKGRENTGLKKQLITELPGIFNRMYRAYKALLEREKELGCGAIRPCIDQSEFIREFIEIANPVAIFWAEHKDEYLKRGEVKKSEIFDGYKAFCERNGNIAGTESVFHRRLKKVAADDGITITDTRHKEGKSQPVYSQFSSQADIQDLAQAIDNGTLEFDE